VRVVRTRLLPLLVSVVSGGCDVLRFLFGCGQVYLLSNLWGGEAYSPSHRCGRSCRYVHYDFAQLFF